MLIGVVQGSLLRTVRNLVGSAPLILVVTKVDLLPEIDALVNADIDAEEEVDRRTRWRRRDGAYVLEEKAQKLAESETPLQRRLKWFYGQRLAKKGLRAHKIILLSGKRSLLCFLFLHLLISRLQLQERVASASNNLPTPL